MYTVYMHVTPDNKRYVGTTSTKPQYRWGARGEHYRCNTLFWDAIQHFGWDNIDHIIVKSNLSQNDAFRLEMELIYTYRTTNADFGYNKAIGGWSATGTKHTDKWKHDASLRQKGKTRKGHPISDKTKQKLSIIMKHNSYGTYRNITNEYRQKALDSQPTKQYVCQCNLDGTIISIYKSVNEAQRYLGIYNISYASKHSSISGGYLWKLLDIELNDSNKNLLIHKIQDMSIHYDFLELWSEREYLICNQYPKHELELHYRKIRQCLYNTIPEGDLLPCRTKPLTHDGYTWYIHKQGALIFIIDSQSFMLGMDLKLSKFNRK